MTEDWYKDVNWHLNLDGVISALVVNDHNAIITSLPIGAGFWHDGDEKLRWLNSKDGQVAQLIASAPETAAERDALKAALKALLESPHAYLEDHVYEIKEREGLGWDGPAVTQWSDAVTAAKALIKKVEND